MLLEKLLEPPDLSAAFYWYERAAEADAADAQFALAMLITQMDPPNFDTARAWLTRAARAGHAEAKDALERLGER
jgi:uncharacterized protein